MTRIAAERRAGVMLPGLQLAPLTMAQAVSRCTDACDNGGYVRVGMVNAAKVVSMHKNERLASAVLSSDLVLADGQAVVWASALLGFPLPERVTGIDLFSELLRQAAARDYRVYLLGATKEVLAACVAEVRRKYPGLVVAGYRDGYFGAAQEAQVTQDIRLARPDLLFIGMSSPRKELFSAHWGSQTGARVVHGVGGSFDIMAGITRRAPLSWQRRGLEWLYRARQEPVRLGRRYLRTNAAFVVLVAVAAVRQKWSGR